MNNKVAILIFALAISHAYGQTCEVDLGTWVGLTTTLTNTAAMGSTLDACVSKKGITAGCCTDAQANSVKTASETLQGTLKTDAGNRDKAILASRAAVAAQRANYILWLAAAASAGPVLTEWTTTAPNGATSTQIGDTVAAITEISDRWNDFFDVEKYIPLYNGFTTYQSNRAACIAEMLKEQAAAKCSACLAVADYATYGIVSTSGTPNTYAFTYGTAVVDRMEEACADYLTGSKTQTDIFYTEQYAKGIEAMTTALNKIKDKTAAGVGEFLTAAAPATLTATPSTISSCTTTSCAWITSTLFADGQLDTTALIRGGDISTRRRRILTERSLQGNAFNPAVGEAGFTITFPSNPGNVINVNDLSALRVGVFSCIVAFFVALLI